MTIHFGHRVEKYDPSTELPYDFCAGIGPLQLGVVFVFDMLIQGFHKGRASTPRHNGQGVCR